MAGIVLTMTNGDAADEQVREKRGTGCAAALPRVATGA
jgi:hypothetical protein